MFEGLLSSIFENLMALMPFVIINQYEEACRFSFGTRPTALKPGFHWRLYLFHTIEKYDVVDDAMELPIQSVITKDGKLVCFRASIAYRICDVVKHHCNVSEFKSSTEQLAMRHLAAKVRSGVYSEIILDLGKVEKSLSNTLTTRFEKWGTEVITVGFVDFAEVPMQLRMFQEASR